MWVASSAPGESRAVHRWLNNSAPTARPSRCSEAATGIPARWISGVRAASRSNCTCVAAATPPILCRMPTDARFTPDHRSNRERMLAGEQYIADDADLTREANRAAALTAHFNAAAGDDHAARD